MNTVLLVFISLVFGAYATSTAEYLLSYNLVDYTLDGVKKFFALPEEAIHTVTMDAKAEQAKLLKKFKKL